MRTAPDVLPPERRCRGFEVLDVRGWCPFHRGDACLDPPLAWWDGIHPMRDVARWQGRGLVHELGSRAYHALAIENDAFYRSSS